MAISFGIKEETPRANSRFRRLLSALLALLALSFVLLGCGRQSDRSTAAAPEPGTGLSMKISAMPELPGVRCEITNHSDREQIIALRPSAWLNLLVIERGDKRHWTMDPATIDSPLLRVHEVVSLPAASTIMFQLAGDKQMTKPGSGAEVFAELKPIEANSTEFDFKLIEKLVYEGPNVKSDVLTWP